MLTKDTMKSWAATKYNISSYLQKLHCIIHEVKICDFSLGTRLYSTGMVHSKLKITKSYLRN